MLDTVVTTKGHRECSKDGVPSSSGIGDVVARLADMRAPKGHFP